MNERCHLNELFTIKSLEIRPLLKITDTFVFDLRPLHRLRKHDLCTFQSFTQYSNLSTFIKVPLTCITSAFSFISAYTFARACQSRIAKVTTIKSMIISITCTFLVARWPTAMSTTLISYQTHQTWRTMIASTAVAEAWHCSSSDWAMIDDIYDNELKKQKSLRVTEWANYRHEDLPWRKTTGMCLPRQNFMTLSWNKC